MLAASFAGCGSKSSSTGPVPDCDGTHLMVFTSGRNLPAGQHNIFLYDFDAGGFRALVGFGGAGQDQHPAITSDGKVIAVERTRAGTGQDVLIYERCSGTFLDRPELVTAADETQPAFSGGTHQLAFVRDTLGMKHLRLYDALGHRFIPLPKLDELAARGIALGSPTLDRDGNTIAFVRDSSGSRDIGVYSRTTDSFLVGLEQAINSPNEERDPWLTPDARFLAFASNRPSASGTLFDIYVYDTVARSYIATDSLNSTGNDVHPSLSPDGIFMIFQSDRTTGPLVKGRWDLYNYNLTLHKIGQSFEESSSEDDTEPYVAWP